MHILDTSPTFLLALSATVLSIPAHVEADHYQLSSHSITKILSIVSNDTSVANYISDIYGPDNPQVEPIDEAVIDWWYFDVVSDDLHTSADAFFYATPILVGDGEHTLFVSFSARFPDGTSFNANVTAESATVVTDGNGSAGFFEGTGFEWSSTPDLSHYVVKIDSPELGIKGTISMKSRAPGHYPCGPIALGENMAVSPGLGWSNSLPDSEARVEFVLNGTALSFTGAGYHDQRWATEYFSKNVDSWFWGHGHFGPYSIVWFDLISTNGTENVSGYASRDGKILAATCSGLVVRPTGDNSTYPPGPDTGRPGGFHITLGIEGDGTLQADVMPEQIIFANTKQYTRWIGKISGSLVDSNETFEGVALFEESNFLAPLK